MEKIAAFSFKVNDVVTDGYIVNFTLHIEFNDSSNFDVLLPVKLNAPKLSVTDFKIDDSQGGNGDGYLQSGETAIVTLTNLNTGQSTSPAATGLLSTVSPWLAIGPAVSVGSIAGAKNIPVSSLGQRIGELDKTRPIVVFCASGMRSSSAAAYLKRNGFNEVHDLGPASAW